MSDFPDKYEGGMTIKVRDHKTNEICEMTLPNYAKNSYFGQLRYGQQQYLHVSKTGSLRLEGGIGLGDENGDKICDGYDIRSPDFRITYENGAITTASCK